jgi:hypothetical protein
VSAAVIHCAESAASMADQNMPAIDRCNIYASFGKGIDRDYFFEGFGHAVLQQLKMARGSSFVSAGYSPAFKLEAMLISPSKRSWHALSGK